MPSRFATLLILLLPAASASAQIRHEIRVPDMPGFHTLVCDFHMHTVFSDGTVWPTVRITHTGAHAASRHFYRMVVLD